MICHLYKHYCTITENYCDNFAFLTIQWQKKNLTVMCMSAGQHEFSFTSDTWRIDETGHAGLGFYNENTMAFSFCINIISAGDTLFK